MSFSVELERRGDAAIAVMRGDLDIATGGMVARLLDVTRIDKRFPVVDDPDELL
jgi:hypothetical protein